MISVFSAKPRRRAQGLAQRFSIACCVVLSALVLPGCPLSDPYFVDPNLGQGGVSGAVGEGGTAAIGNVGGSAPSGGMSGSVGAAGGADACEQDPGKTAPGACGCGAPETNLCLVHRYSFAGMGTVVTDSVGTAQANAIGAMQAMGTIALPGMNQYVNLPDGIVSVLANATIELWVTWNGGPAWQRIFDFGNSATNLGVFGTSGVSYLVLTPLNSNTGVTEVLYSENGVVGELRVDGTTPLFMGALTHLAVVVDVTGKKLELYRNGALENSAPFLGSLSKLHDVNNWLGRSQYSADPYFNGTLHELRLFAAARNAAQIAASFAAGPDVLPAE